MTQIKFLGDQSIVGKWLLIHKYESLPQYFPPLCRVWIPLSHTAFDILLWVNIFWDMLIYILYYSDSVSWWTQNSRKCINLQKMENYHNILLRSCKLWISLSHISFGIFLWVNIDLCMLIFISHDSDLVSWGSQHCREMSRDL